MKKIPALVPSWDQKDFLNNGGKYDSETGFYLTEVDLHETWTKDYLCDKDLYSGQAVLIPQMLPSNSWKDNLRLQLEPGQWDKLRRHSYASSGFRCQICGSKGNPYIECHEEWVFYPKPKIQYLNRLRALCTLCHKAHHLGFANRIGKLNEVSEHIMQINNWSSSELNKSFEQAETWVKELEKTEWTLNLNLLQKSGLAHLLR